jgi:hypothetical protein
MLAFAAGVGQELHLKTRDVYTGPPPAGVAISQDRVRRPGPSHQIIQFDHPPGMEDLDALAAAGARAIAVIPDNAVSAIVPEDMPAIAAGVRWTGELQVYDKLSPALETADLSQIEAVVEFHADVGTDAQQAILDAESVTSLRPAALLPNHVLVSTPIDGLRALAAHDEVAYIFPADPALVAENGMLPCAGMLTISGPVAQYANILHGWDLDADHAVHLGYFFGPLTSKLPASVVQSEVIRALTEWSRVANVVFHPESSATAARTVLIKFASGQHGDSWPFDGLGGALAHTFYPVPINPESIAGDMHLDADENWHAGGDVDVYSVALHEAGHAIGLGHSDKPGDVMYPYYRNGMRLSANDIGAARTLYGEPGALPPLPAPVTAVTPAPPLSLTLNPITPPGMAAQASIAGMVSGGTPPLNVQWQTDRGYTGNATMGDSSNWNATGVTLVTGANTITVSVFDSAQHTASQSATVTRMPAASPGGTVPISVRIVSPSSAVITARSSTISVSGTASAGSGITQVTWQTSGGASGIADGVDRWSAPRIPLLTGTNTIVIRSFDAKGATAWASIVVVRQ